MASGSGHKKREVTVDTNTVRSDLEWKSTLSSAGAGHEYDVFLSFRGEDTRKGFTDHLYHRMIDDGVRVFKDNVELPVGQAIGPKLFEALKKSKIAIPIFSKDYASTKWCLKELAFMMKCRKERNQMVLPVFYDVTPHQVRHQTGTYATAFSEHVEKYDEDTIKQWKGALAEVSYLKGWDMENETAGYEGELTKKIVAKVLSELKKAHLLVTDELVGIEEHERAVRGLLKMSVMDVRIVGIWGMGGIGKTTLAKFIFNQIVHQFDRHSFLKDIREISSKRDGLERLQSWLVSDLSKQARQEFASVEKVSHELKCRFTENKVLILLDDVDQVSQLDALAGELEWFGPGSRIIVTTRNREALDNLLSKRGIPQESCAYYEVKPMNRERALQLFCKHAFRQDNPKDELSGLSHDVVETTGGLPLALEVTGSYLFGKRKQIWEETLRKLKQAPRKEVYDSLKISYDMLDEEQKQMFLDVACLFIGEDIDVVVEVWKDRNYSAETGKDVLLLLCLIKIENDNRIWMHDQLRDLGRKIVQNENINKPGMRSRLCREDEARDLLEENMGSPSVEALCLNYELGRDYCVTDEQLRNLPNLRFLRLCNAEVSGNFQEVLTELRWLRWRCSDSRNSIPTNLFLKKLLVLDLSFSMIGDNWSCNWSSLQMSVKLKVLNLSSCTELRRTPNFSMFPNLKRLILDECSWLEVIDASMRKLENLILLSVKDCWTIKELPISSHMKRLEILNARGCHSLARLPKCIGQLTSLIDLNLASTGIKDISFGSLTNLRRLSLANTDLRELPESIGKLKSLTELDLSGTNFPDLPGSLADLEDLQVLKIIKSGIHHVPDAIGSHRTFQLIVDPSRGNLKERILRESSTTVGMNIYFNQLDSLNGFEALQALNFFGGALGEDKWLPRSLNITFCKGIKKLPIPCSLKFLISLSVFDCENLQGLEGLNGLQALQQLMLSRCQAIEKLPNLSNLKCLIRLNCLSCVKLQGLEGLDGLKVLKELNIDYCVSIMKLSILSNLKCLTSFSCFQCEKLQELEGLDGLEALQKLNIGGCVSIIKLSNLSNLKCLTRLYCQGCKKLQGLEGLDGLGALKDLNIGGCVLIIKLPNLSNLKCLESLDCSCCGNLQGLAGLDGLKALEKLDSNYCKAIKKLPDLSKLKKLEELNIWGCKSLVKIKGWDELRSRHIRIFGSQLQKAAIREDIDPEESGL